MDPSPSISAPHTPAVAIVLPVRDEEASIEAAVRSALDQTYRGSLEVVVADGGSSDGTRTIVSRIAEADDRVRLVDNASGTAPAGMNVGIAATEADIIARCDGHSVLRPDYVEVAVASLLESGADNVGGMQEVVGKGPTSRAIAAAMSSRIGAGDARFRIGGQAGPVDTVYLGVFRRSTLDAVGGFDERMVRNQDYELNHRIRAAGGVVRFDPRLSVEYTPRSTLASLWRQYFDYGRGKRTMLRRHPGSLRWRQLAPPLLVIALIASAILAFTPLRAFAGLVPAAYALAVLVSAAGFAVSRTDGAMLRLVAVLPTMHVGWGSGFLFGPAIRQE